MSPLWYLVILSLIVGIGRIIVMLRNEKYKSGEKAQDIEENIKIFVEKAIPKDETLVLADYSPGMDAYLALTDRGIYCQQLKRKGSKFFVSAYSDIRKCEYMNFGMSKVPPDGEVIYIKIKSKSETFLLGQFIQMNEIARELAKRGF